MKISFTKFKAKKFLAGVLALLAVCIAFFPGIFVFELRKLIAVPLVIFMFLFAGFFLLTDIKFNNKWNKVLFITSIFVIPIIGFECVEILQRSFLVSSVKAFAVNWLIYFGIFVILLTVTGKLHLSAYIFFPLVLLIGFINHYVLIFRGTPMQPWDVAAAKTAMNVVSNFIFTIDEYAICSLLLAAAILIFMQNIDPIAIPRKPIWKTTIATLLICAVCFGIPALCIKDNNAKFFRDLWNQKVSSEKNGYIVNFLINLQLLNNAPPEEYSSEKVNDILKNYTENTSAEKLPNIIVIMNEAFADLEAVSDLSLEDDPLNFVHSLKGKENTVTGTMDVSVFGGGTCNTEYEFLTSNVCSMLRAGSYPMQQFVNSESVSIASNLKQLGYQTVGIHPYYGSGWNRQRAYPLLGFDRFITIDDFDESTEMVREYVSDTACYDKIKSVYEQAGDKPLFLFAVTIQNHGGYETEWSDKPDDIKGLIDYPQTEQYLELANISDKAIEELIAYFDNQDTETIVLFFGDHQPSLGSEYSALFPKTDEKDLKKATEKYRVPFFLWANFDIKSESDVIISPNFLAPFLLEKCSLPQTAYYNYLNEMRKTIPSITAMAYRDAKNNLLDVNETDNKTIIQYDMMQYNNVFDKSNLSKELFFYDK